MNTSCHSISKPTGNRKIIFMNVPIIIPTKKYCTLQRTHLLGKYLRKNLSNNIKGLIYFKSTMAASNFYEESDQQHNQGDERSGNSQFLQPLAFKDSSSCFRMTDFSRSDLSPYPQRCNNPWTITLCNSSVMLTPY